MQIRIVTDWSVLYFVTIMSVQKRKEEKRSAILAAASAVFKDRRYDEVKLDDIAKRAGVGKGTLYLYFKSKEDLFVALAGEGTGEVAERIREIADETGPYQKRLFRFGRELSAFASNRHGWMRMMQQVSSPELEAKMHPQHEPVRNAVFYLLEKGIEEGALRSDVCATTLESILVGTIFFRIRQMQGLGRKIDLEEVLQCCWDAVCRK